MKIPVRIGEKFGVVTFDSKGNEKDYLISQLLEYKNDEIMEIALPIKEGRLIPLHINSTLKVIYYRNNGQYCFTAKVIERRKGGIHTLKIQVLSDVEKIQRRDYFRLDIVLPLKVNYHIPGKNEEYRCFDTFTLDISGGGLKFASKDSLPENKNVTCEIELKDKVISINAKIVRCTTVYNEEYSFEIGAEFLRMDKKIREEIINFIFDEQRRLMRKGMV